MEQNMENKEDDRKRYKGVHLSVCDYWSVCEVAGRIGVSERTVMRRIKDPRKDHRIPAIKIGGIWRINKRDLEKVMGIKNEAENLYVSTITMTNPHANFSQICKCFI